MRAVRYDLDLALDLAGGSLEGRVRLTVRNDSDAAARRVSLLLNRGLRVIASPRSVDQDVVAVEGFEALRVGHVRVTLPEDLPAGRETTLDLAIAGEIGDYVETGMRYVRDRIDPAYTVLRRDAFAYPIPGIPSWAKIRAAGSPLFTWTARISVPATHTVACGGERLGRESTGDRVRDTFRSLRPTTRMDFAIARYETLERGRLGVHHFPEDAGGAARVLDGLEHAFRTYAEWFGPLPDDTPFVVIEVPDGWGSQADVTCILQTAAAFRDPARMVEVYHEISHLWNVPPTDHPSPRWNEGLAMFLQYRMADARDGTSRLLGALARADAKIRERLDAEPRLRDIPFARYGAEGCTDLSYSVGMLMFADLYRRIGSDVFDGIIGGFYRAYRDRGASSEEFLRFADRSVGGTLGSFFREWFETTAWLIRRPEDGAPSRT